MSDSKLRLYSTLSRKKELFVPGSKDKVLMYTCGPTVYDYAHIGNFRTYVFEDLLRRTLQFLGMTVCQVMNLTDVDDKTIRGANQQNVSLDEYTAVYKKAFFEDLKKLNIESAEYYPAATDFIEDIILTIKDLENSGYAYQGRDGSVYYSIDKFKDYGELSHLKLEDLQEGASNRIASDSYDKENVGDFVLWKAYDPERDGNIYWDSPWGKGRPGWHIECSTMAVKLLGPTIDIHMGGVDNIFPHHENEIAQSEAWTGKQFVRYWVHAEHLIVNNKKMSKSLKNFYTLRDLLAKGYTGDQVRYALLQTHYKVQLNFTFDSLDAAKASLQRINDFIYRLQNLSVDGDSGKVQPILDKALTSFTAALTDDINISAALATIFDMIREINMLIDNGHITTKEAAAVVSLMQKFNNVLGVISFKNESDDIPAELVEALKQRQQVRKDKNWSEADRLRDFILEKGYLIEDTPTGARLKKK